MKVKLLSVFLCILLIVAAATAAPMFVSGDDPYRPDPFYTTTTTGTTPAATTTTTTTTAAPPAPTTTRAPTVGRVTNLRATAQTLTSARISWVAAPGATRYRVYRTDGTHVIRFLRSVATNSFVDTGLRRGRTYTYQVIGYTRAGTRVFGGAVSNRASITTLARATPLPRMVRRTRTAVTLRVDRVTGASGYEVQRSRNRNFRRATTRRFSRNTFRLTGLRRNTQYHFRVRSFRTINGRRHYTPFRRINVRTRR